MKAWLFAIFGLIVFIALSMLNQSYLEKNTNQLTTQLEKVEKAIQSKEWYKAGRGLRAIQKKWRQIKPVWSLLLHHEEIDAIDQALIRTVKAVQSQDDPTAKVEQGSLNKYIEHIPRREEFSLVNIL